MDEKISKQDGENASVAIDVGEASLKASAQKGTLAQQQKMLNAALKNGKLHGANINDAMEDLSSINTASQMGGQIGNAGKMTAETAKKMKTAMKNATDAHGNAMFSHDELTQLDGLDGAGLAGWIAAKQAGNLSGMHGLAIGNKTVGFALGDNGNLRLTGVDASTKTSTGNSKVDDNTIVKKSGNSTKLDDAFSINTGTQIKGTTLDPAAWTEVSAKMAKKYGKEAVVGAVADIKNGNFHNFRKMAEGTFGKENGDNATDNLKAQWNSSDDSNRLGEALLVGSATTAAYAADKKFNKGRVFNKVQDKFDNLIGGEKSSPDTFNNPTEGSDNNQPNETNKEKTNNIHNDSFEGKKFNEGGGRTPAYQSYMDSVAKEGEKGKFIESIAKHGKIGVAAAAVLAAGYEAYDYATDGGASKGISKFADWMTSEHGPKGGSGQVPGSSGYKTSGGSSSGVSTEKVIGTALDAASFLTPVASALMGSDAGSGAYGGDELKQIQASMPSGYNGGTPSFAQNIIPSTSYRSTRSSIRTGSNRNNK